MQYKFMKVILQFKKVREKMKNLFMRFYHRKRKVHVYFLFLLCKSSIWITDKQILKIIVDLFNTLQYIANYVI